MFSERWTLLREMIDGGLITTPDHTLTHVQLLHLFQAFLLQVKENEGMVYVVPSENNGLLATYFADRLITSLGISARGLIPVHTDVTLHLALLLKKSDLLITLSDIEVSLNTLGAAAMAKQQDVPLITFSGGQRDNPLVERGDLNIHFEKADQTLIQTGQFSLLKAIIESWPYYEEPPRFEPELLLKKIKPKTLPTGLRI